MAVAGPWQPHAAARGRTACFTPRRHGKNGRSGGSTGTRRCTAAAHSPQKNTSGEVFAFFNPKTNPEGALARAVRNGGTHERLARETVSGTEDQRADVPRMAHDRAPQEDAHSAGAPR